MTSQNRLQIPSKPKSKSREVRKLETEKKGLEARLLRIKLKKKQKKIHRQQQTLAMQVVSLTFETKALIDGEI